MLCNMRDAFSRSAAIARWLGGWRATQQQRRVDHRYKGGDFGPVKNNLVFLSTSRCIDAGDNLRLEEAVTIYGM